MRDGFIRKKVQKVVSKTGVQITWHSFKMCCSYYISVRWSIGKIDWGDTKSDLSSKAFVVRRQIFIVSPSIRSKFGSFPFLCPLFPTNNFFPIFGNMSNWVTFSYKMRI